MLEESLRNLRPDRRVWRGYLELDAGNFSEVPSRRCEEHGIADPVLLEEPQPVLETADRL